MEMTTLDELNAAIDRLEYLALARAENANDRNDARSAAERAHAAINALPGLIESAKENAILKRLAPEYYQWPGKSGAELAPEWLQHRLKYGGANVDGDMLAVYDWHDRRSLAAPGDYVVDGEKGLYVLVNARAALKGT
jgi:hypothetical protein